MVNAQELALKLRRKIKGSVPLEKVTDFYPVRKLFSNGVEGHSSLMGFTLIEFIMVIVIMGILVTLAMPRFEVYYEIKLQAAAKRLASDIRYVQSAAISKHTDTRIVFDDIHNSYQASYYDTVSGSWQPIQDPFTRLDLTRDFNTDSQYKRIDITSVDINTTDTLKFNWWGTPRDGNDSDLTNEGSVGLAYKGGSITIKVIPQTGKVNIE